MNATADKPEEKKPEEKKPEEKKLAKEDLDRLAQETLRGEHGAGPARKKSLGKNYDAVQKEVLRIRKAVK